ncbi:6-pyruvoyl trahydropterin synthase family protein [Microvirga lotononidis]|uniref:6-carboxy-5,6,7,8-tetrahydropterin synthase n=1 Tax=Microvirga lotononidis TaxID=864069 RepID=I4YK76_9HYPH|nr:6-carboxytetrahydropterin synthase [Microvirga lotononidis]EIM24368.1 6-pyruvoyl-tetrahydropterin synthase [Microvirga lotononidis]WQO30330.1 6-carboxytetrahydropterin synthase [Microvirga lotononidis]
MSWQAKRYHDISCGHRVVGHEGKCGHLHGHNYRVHFTCEADELDNLGRVIDFSEIKSKLCMWLEENWDHKMLLWEHDPVANVLIDNTTGTGDGTTLGDGIVLVPFNPTAENIAQHLVLVVGPQQLKGTGIKLRHCEVEETRKCSAVYTLRPQKNDFGQIER